MTTNLDRLNAAPREEGVNALVACCGSAKWAELILDERPFADLQALADAAQLASNDLDPKDWLEAFASHPRIGARKDSHSAQSTSASDWSAEEQAGTQTATLDVFSDLAAANLAYEQKFGHIFIVCATGKSSEEMLALCRDRLANDPQAELQIAIGELRKIAQIRLRKLIGAAE